MIMHEEEASFEQDGVCIQIINIHDLMFANVLMLR